MTTLPALRALVLEAPRDELPAIVGQLAALQAEALARLASAAMPTASAELVALTPEWAEARGYRFETAQKLARSGRLAGAVPAPSSGKGRRRRWLVPVTLRAAEAR